MNSDGTHPPRPTIVVSAVVLTDEAGRIVTVRKRGTDRFMLPGGKPETGESPAQCAARECAEEIGVVLKPEDLTMLGQFRAAAANEPGHDVECTTYTHPVVGVPIVSREIDELRWLDPQADLPTDLAPMLEFAVLPALERTAPSH